MKWLIIVPVAVFVIGEPVAAIFWAVCYLGLLCLVWR